MNWDEYDRKKSNSGRRDDHLENEEEKKIKQRILQLVREEEENLKAVEQQKVLNSEEKYHQMREKLESLRADREAGRIQFVNEKRKQQWRANCDELRSLIWKKHQDQLCIERLEQLKIKEESKKNEEIKNRLFDEMWKKDAETKFQNELFEARKQKEMAQLLATELESQISGNILKKTQQRNAQIEFETKIRLEQKKLLELEKYWEEEENRLRKLEQKKSLDYLIKIKNEQKALETRELEKEKELWDKYLNDKFRDDSVEMENKKQALQEAEEYYRHIEKTKREQKLKEKELDVFFAKEMEKMWERREKQWAAERKAREQLQKDTHDACMEMIQQNISKSLEGVIETLKEHAEVDKKTQDYQNEESKKKEDSREQAMKYQTDLLIQMELQQQQERDRQLAAEQEMKAREQEEMKYQEKLKEALADTPKGHPHRKYAFNF